MTKTRCLLSILMLILGSAAPAADLFVATDGNDAWSGGLPSPNADRTDGPFATLQRARDAVRTRKTASPAEAVTVHVRAGMYPLAQTLKLGKEDSGTADAPVVYRAYQNERPVLIGGRTVGGWAADQGGVLRADLAAQGLQGTYFRQLICDGHRQHLARYPNFDPQNPYGGGWAYVDGKLVPMYQDIPGEDKRTLVYKAQDARTWSKPAEKARCSFSRGTTGGTTSSGFKRWTRRPAS